MNQLGLDLREALRDAKPGRSTRELHAERARAKASAPAQLPAGTRLAGEVPTLHVELAQLGGSVTFVGVSPQRASMRFGEWTTRQGDPFGEVECRTCGELRWQRLVWAGGRVWEVAPCYACKRHERT